MKTRTTTVLIAGALRLPATALLLPAAILLFPRALEAQEPGRVTLEGAVATALENNPALARSRAEIEGHRADRMAAWGDFLPDVSLAYGLSEASSGRLDPTGQSITTTSNSLQLQASVDLFDGLRRPRELARARRNLEAGEARGEETRFQTILDVETAFFDAVARRQLVEVERGRVRRLERQMSFVRQRVQNGKATASDSLRSLVDLNDARVALIRARNDAREASFALARAMGVPDPVEPAAGSDLSPPALPLDREEAMAQLTSSSPELRSARAEALAAEAALAASRSSYLPTVSLGGGYAWQSPDFPPSRRSWSVELSASYPLFDGLRREADVRRARSRVDVARAEARSRELALRAELDAAFGRLEAARAARELAEKSVSASREDLRVTEERYRLGLATILDLQAAQTGVVEAEAGRVRSRFDQRLSVARLEALLGMERGTP